MESLAYFALQETDIDCGSLRQRVQDAAAGGFVCFEGWVRNHQEGREVVKLEYQAYRALANSIGERLVRDAMERFGLRQAVCVHRVGMLDIGGVAVWIGVASDHRAEAFDACEWLINEVKHHLPIWKKEYYMHGEPDWVACHRCQHT